MGEGSARRAPAASAAPVAAAILAWLAPLEPAAALTLQRIGPEFQANTTTFLWQQRPDVSALSNGQFFAVWDDQSTAAPDTQGSAVRGRRIGANGLPVGPDRVVNPTRQGDQLQAAIAPLAGGGFMVILADDSGAGADKSGFAVRGQRFSAAGARVGAQFQVNTVTAGDQAAPALAKLSNGRLAAAYEYGAREGIRGQVLSPTGAKVGPEFRASLASVSENRDPEVVALDAAGFVVLWTALSDDPGGRGSLNIMAQRFSGTGAKIGAPVRVNRTFALIQEEATGAFIGAGRYVAAWTDASQSAGDTSGRAVRGQIMTAAGTRVGPELIIPTRRIGDQSQPAVAAFPNGRFIVVWTDDSGSPDDPSGTAVRGQLFSATGTKLGPEFRVNGRTQGDQTEPAIAVVDGSDFLVLWTDLSQGLPPDASATGVRGQFFRVTP
jgi:hypothetical protein